MLLANASGAPDAFGQEEREAHEAKMAMQERGKPICGDMIDSRRAEPRLGHKRASVSTKTWFVTCVTKRNIMKHDLRITSKTLCILITTLTL